MPRLDVRRQTEIGERKPEVEEGGVGGCDGVGIGFGGRRLGVRRLELGH
ncbi:MAG: hypothetical protein R2843_10620 [Thermomicrobiales bacterium]